MRSLPDLQQGWVGGFLTYAYVSSSLRIWLRSRIISMSAAVFGGLVGSRLRPALG